MREFRKIPGYDYSISNYGDVRNDKTGEIVNTYNHTCGYRIACLSDLGKEKIFFVHRLVANAFIPNPQKKPTVNHIDGNKANNCVDNLEWATYSENSLHCARVLGKANRCPPSENTVESRRKPVVCIETGVIYKSITSAAKSVGVAQATMSRHLIYNTKMHNGYNFKFINKENTQNRG